MRIFMAVFSSILALLRCDVHKIDLLLYHELRLDVFEENFKLFEVCKVEILVKNEMNKISGGPGLCCIDPPYVFD